MALSPKYWNRRRECISDNLPEIYGSSSELNQRLNHELRKAEDIISLRGKELKKQFAKQRGEGLPGTQRVNEVAKSKIETAIQMIKSAVKKGFVPKYVLADPWVITDGFIKAIKGIKTKAGDKIDAMGLMKTNRIVSINGKNINARLVPG